MKNKKEDDESDFIASEGWKVVEEYGDNLRSRRRWGLDPKHKAMLLMIDVE